MDITGIVALMMVVVLVFTVGSLRRRVVKLEGVVLRLRDHVAELVRHSSAASDDARPTAPGSGGESAARASAGAPEAGDVPPSRIDIEPFVD